MNPLRIAELLLISACMGLNILVYQTLPKWEEDLEYLFALDTNVTAPSNISSGVTDTTDPQVKTNDLTADDDSAEVSITESSSSLTSPPQHKHESSAESLPKDFIARYDNSTISEMTPKMFSTKPNTSSTTRLRKMEGFFEAGDSTKSSTVVIQTTAALGPSPTSVSTTSTTSPGRKNEINELLSEKYFFAQPQKKTTPIASSPNCSVLNSEKKIGGLETTSTTLKTPPAVQEPKTGKFTTTSATETRSTVSSNQKFSPKHFHATSTSLAKILGIPPKCKPSSTVISKKHEIKSLTKIPTALSTASNQLKISVNASIAASRKTTTPGTISTTSLSEHGRIHESSAKSFPEHFFAQSPNSTISIALIGSTTDPHSNLTSPTTPTRPVSLQQNMENIAEFLTLGISPRPSTLLTADRKTVKTEKISAVLIQNKICACISTTSNSENSSSTTTAPHAAPILPQNVLPIDSTDFASTFPTERTTPKSEELPTTSLTAPFPKSNLGEISILTLISQTSSTSPSTSPEQNTANTEEFLQSKLLPGSATTTVISSTESLTATPRKVHSIIWPSTTFQKTSSMLAEQKIENVKDGLTQNISPQPPSEMAMTASSKLGRISATKKSKKTRPTIAPRTSDRLDPKTSPSAILSTITISKITPTTNPSWEQKTESVQDSLPETFLDQPGISTKTTTTSTTSPAMAVQTTSSSLLLQQSENGKESFFDDFLITPQTTEKASTKSGKISTTRKMTRPTKVPRTSVSLIPKTSLSAISPTVPSSKITSTTSSSSEPKIENDENLLQETFLGQTGFSTKTTTTLATSPATSVQTSFSLLQRIENTKESFVYNSFTTPSIAQNTVAASKNSGKSSATTKRKMTSPTKPPRTSVSLAPSATSPTVSSSKMTPTIYSPLEQKTGSAEDFLLETFLGQTGISSAMTSSTKTAISSTTSPEMSVQTTSSLFLLHQIANVYDFLVTSPTNQNTPTASTKSGEISTTARRKPNWPTRTPKPSTTSAVSLAQKTHFPAISISRSSLSPQTASTTLSFLEQNFESAKHTVPESFLGEPATSTASTSTTTTSLLQQEIENVSESLFQNVPIQLTTTETTLVVPTKPGKLFTTAKRKMTKPTKAPITSTTSPVDLVQNTYASLSSQSKSSPQTSTTSSLVKLEQNNEAAKNLLLESFMGEPVTTTVATVSKKPLHKRITTTPRRKYTRPRKTSTISPTPPIEKTSWMRIIKLTPSRTSQSRKKTSIKPVLTNSSVNTASTLTVGVVPDLSLPNSTKTTASYITRGPQNLTSPGLQPEASKFSSPPTSVVAMLPPINVTERENSTDGLLDENVEDAGVDVKFKVSFYKNKNGTDTNRSGLSPAEIQTTVSSAKNFLGHALRQGAQRRFDDDDSLDVKFKISLQDEDAADDDEDNEQTNRTHGFFEDGDALDVKFKLSFPTYEPYEDSENPSAPNKRVARGCNLDPTITTMRPKPETQEMFYVHVTLFVGITTIFLIVLVDFICLFCEEPINKVPMIVYLVIAVCFSLMNSIFAGILFKRAETLSIALTAFLTLSISLTGLLIFDLSCSFLRS